LTTASSVFLRLDDRLAGAADRVLGGARAMSSGFPFDFRWVSTIEPSTRYVLEQCVLPTTTTIYAPMRYIIVSK
jgi:hypothetical protein